MEAKPKTCVITLFNEETKSISYHHVSQTAVAEALAKSTSVDVPLEDFGFKVDDDFARRLGGMILLILAGRSPFLKEHLALTTEGASGATDTPSAEKRSWFWRKRQ
ncbi:hypothetical protein [Trinickia fusca]|uniref:Uncharacterized protein n=1 Tax=Trinickia fusca TaxID=2419777 RepID=A0A494X8S0_9BURK|nr:hypothetical protein [Trinickia fusca]RKP46860.1 hypothetical protein D7S89_16005 [Trinickia fusca]